MYSLFSTHHGVLNGAIFVQEGNGRISAVELRHLLVGLGEKMSEEEVEILIHGKEDAQVYIIPESVFLNEG